MSAVDLAVLDLAGTTVRDDGLVEDAFVDALASVGAGPDTAGFADRLAHLRTTMGRSKLEVFREMLGDDATARRANESFEAAYGARLTSGAVRPIDGAEEAIAALHDADVRVCLTTGFSPATLTALLDALGWHDRADLALAPGPGVRGRPHPDLVLSAVLRLGIDDVRRVAVAGDTASDLLAGTCAGASVVAGVLTGAHDRATLEAAPHTHVLDSIADFPALCR
ncbi:MAG TPA: HAD family hydrolase [Acidimicrobiia bacterium]